MPYSNEDYPRSPSEQEKHHHTLPQPGQVLHVPPDTLIPRPTDGVPHQQMVDWRDPLLCLLKTKKVYSRGIPISKDY